MTIKARPRILVDETTSSNGRSICGGTLYTSSYYEKIQRYVETDYRKYIALGLPLPYMPYERHRVVKSFSNGYSSRYNGYAHLAWCYGGIGLATPNWDSLDTNARKALYSNISDKDSLNLAVSLAEMRETVGLVASTATRLGLAYRNLRRGRVRDAFTALGIHPKQKLSKNDIRLAGLPKRKGGWTAGYHQKHMLSLVPQSQRKLDNFAANAWLELQYGWKPLLSDVYGAAKFAADFFNNRRFDIEVSGQSKDVYSGIGRAGSPTNVDSTSSYTAVVKYGARLRVTNANLRLAAGLGFTNPLLIAWELIPFSFVVDWFVDIGPTLAALSALHGYSVTESYKVTFLSGDAEGTAKSADFPCSGTVNEFRMTRTTGASLPSIPMPSFNIKDALGITRATSAIALLVQSFKK